MKEASCLELCRKCEECLATSRFLFRPREMYIRLEVESEDLERHA